LEDTCQFQEGEVDIVLLQHTFEVIRSNGREETITATLEAYGDRNGGAQAMAKLVGVPCGMAVAFILEGVLTKPGVHAPYDEEVSVGNLYIRFLESGADMARPASCSGTVWSRRRASPWSSGLFR
jgi:saccharopine dehydrogenase-like NADP-dependent oxidoreductase